MNPQASAALETQGITITYLGQVGFLLQFGGTRIVIDPYLTDAVDRLPGQPQGLWVRSYPPPILPGELKEIDLVLCTHDHLDHTEPETLCGIATASPGCRFAGPKSSVQQMLQGGIAPERTMVLKEGLTCVEGGLVVEPIAVAHEAYAADAEGFDHYLGYLLHWNGTTFFHAGDAVATPRLSEALSRHAIHAAFLPINGGNAQRRSLGIVGNMNAREAIDLAVRHRMGLLVPTHYDLYPKNGALLAEFVTSWEAHPIFDRPRFKAFLPGESMVYEK